MEKTSGVRKRESEIWENGGGRQHPAPLFTRDFRREEEGGGGEPRISPSDSITQILFRYLPPPNKIQDSFLSIKSDG